MQAEHAVRALGGAGRSHRAIGWDQAMIGYFHVRPTVRNA
jgi:hypothetical protein